MRIHINTDFKAVSLRHVMKPRGVFFLPYRLLLNTILFTFCLSLHLGVSVTVRAE